MQKTRRVVVGAMIAAVGILTACSSAPAPGGSAPSTPRPSTTAAATTRAAAAAPAVAATHSAAKPTPPKPTACARNTKPKKIIVSVPEQHAWMCAGHRLVYSTAVTTGAVDLAYDSTPTGTFQVQSIQRNQVLTLLSGAQYTVKYWIPFDGPLFGFHDSSWQKMPYGSQKYRTKGSHGCVHTPLAALKFMASWATVGTSVRIKAT